MPRCQYKKTINNILGSMSPLEYSYPTTAVSEHTTIVEAQEKDLKTSFMKMIETLKKKINKSPEMQEKISILNKFLKEFRKYKQTAEENK